MTDTNQASEDKLIEWIVERTSLIEEIGDDTWREFEVGTFTYQLQALIRTEKLKLLDEVIHQSTVNLKSAKAVAGWAELRKEQLEAEL